MLAAVATHSQLLRRIEPLLKWRYLVLVAVAFLSSVQHMRGTGEDWEYFVKGSELIIGQHHPYTPLAGGLHLYANYPDFQIGPLSFLLAIPFRVLGPGDGRIPAVLAMTAVIPFLVLLMERAARQVWSAAEDRSEPLLQLTVLLGGLVVVQAWAPLATIYAHLDDVLVLSALTAAVWAVAYRRPWVLGAAIGLGIAAKPWGVVALPLILALPGPAIDKWRALGLGSAIAGMAWLPFVIGDPDTLDAIQPAVLTHVASVLHLFGVPLNDAPSWVRPVQLGTALVGGTLAVARNRWGAVLLVGIALRIGLDPQTFLYYSAGLLVAALVWDLLRSPHPAPVWTLAGFVLLNVAYVSGIDPHTRAILRLLITAAVVGTVLLAPAGRGPTRATPSTPRRPAGP